MTMESDFGSETFRVFDKDYLHVISGVLRVSLPAMSATEFLVPHLTSAPEFVRGQDELASTHLNHPWSGQGTV